MDEFFHWTLNSVYILRNKSLIYLQVPSLPPPENSHWIPIFISAKIILDKGLSVGTGLFPAWLLSQFDWFGFWRTPH